MRILEGKVLRIILSTAEEILLCIPWYCKYGISYRDWAEMMEERGVEADRRIRDQPTEEGGTLAP